jgi:hypothetical protein
MALDRRSVRAGWCSTTATSRKGWSSWGLVMVKRRVRR